MKRPGLLNPATLLGAEILETLERRPETWSGIRLLTLDPEAVGTLADVGGSAQLVEAFDPEEPGCDVLIVCGEPAPPPSALAAFSGPVLYADCPHPEARPVVAGVNLEAAIGEGPLASPAPAVVLLALLLRPLADLGLRGVSATLLQPASAYQRVGLDELLEQARAILAFQGSPAGPVLPAQLAFNLVPATGSSAPLVTDLRSLLGRELEVGIQVVQAGIFHGLSASVLIRLSEAADASALRERLAEAPHVALDDSPETLGPVRCAASSEVLVGAIEAAGEGGDGFRLWAVMDQLTRGGALNAVEIAEAWLTPPRSVS